jgi:hypothetical protein
MWKSKENIVAPDARYLNEARIDPNTGAIRRPEIGDLYDDMAELSLPVGVPSALIRQFNIARSAYVYSWFDYEMITLAEEHAYTVIEMAIRRRAKDENTGMSEKTGMRGAIDHARAKGWLSDEDYGVMETGGEPIPYLTLLPVMRNDLLHGNPRLLAAASYQILEVVFGILIKLFPPIVSASHG